MTIAEALSYAKGLFITSETPLIDAQWLLMKVLDCDRGYLYTWPERKLSDEQLEQFKAFSERRAKGEPVAFITGSRSFWTFDLEVNDSTLIPRSDTEILVQTCLELEVPEHADVLELGTGTGAIALALASEKPDWAIIAVDKSHEAVELARRNLARLEFGNVEVFTSDWFSKVELGKTFNLIVSNPPYIDPEDPHLTRGDVQFEPKSALISEHQGYKDIEYIITNGLDFLCNEGWLALEHGAEQALQVRDIFLKKGYKRVNTVQDYANLDRVTFAQKSV
ncbi:MULTISPECIES: peptide chain release factor N(5)-glutamine methyltransferase [Gammaproteobacteria]|uniref:peptide chain release factor N(5)-glutamine methyltransferase n=1 Tax=Gammaproteobacteria TaxID=1236 RepID=UPI000DCFB73A|nr:MULTISPECIES: peptide chain release factor N(5)-glutamine methyltransferase [Gammaproteobacteria]RTE87423.1 peptide chain release factor N(5)-glutamine methyltransferase [Aliidiomarina sp. B3213]TCZ92792.1 peptide chain release factor N(5)-glutamine methyltransferase [Lysobacter sp. N42]